MAVVYAVVAAGCGVPDDSRPPEDAIRVTPDDGSRGVPVRSGVEVSVAEGTLRSVRMVRRGDGAVRTVPGRFSANRRSWHPAAAAGTALELAAKYTVDAVAVDSDGRRTARHTTFTTKPPPHRFIGFFRPEHRQTVGTAMIVSLEFNRPIEDRAAVERAVRVSAEPQVPIAAHWFGRSRLDFRPRDYWRPGTRVTLDLRLRDVRGGKGAYGVQRKTVWFRVGRDQRSVVDVGRRTLTVHRKGRAAQRLPVTAGTRKNPTYNGKMVISEKYPVTRMNGDTVGFGGEYDIDDVPHAMRLTRSGTFLHGNYWASSRVFGKKNTSHGCVGLKDKRGGSARSPAGRFFRRSLVGDLVTVRGSHDKTVAASNGLGGWNMTWERWRSGSALN
ncbi:Ig-like domain-containing protein [Streptomyces sp. NBC_01795]|nr:MULTISPECIES: Ig-like domain-containing protein [unclassified Streptomyces]WSA97080.1 Ig-like domain-containing protein [Streptomyces sp. NBC_01795]WSB81505.1 Ig-like domain-containing protein [Streptomyces sp. NBC_01775]WSS17734.1 Ig-like domain-containing protein [Streptomyces sp. NBC_01186]WSS46485.1 Ig-like domain-containing protein [Streptomyces sp. NBC_01187]